MRQHIEDIHEQYAEFNVEWWDIRAMIKRNSNGTLTCPYPDCGATFSTRRPLITHGKDHPSASTPHLAQRIAETIEKHLLQMPESPLPLSSNETSDSNKPPKKKIKRLHNNSPSTTSPEAQPIDVAAISSEENIEDSLEDNSNWGMVRDNLRYFNV